MINILIIYLLYLFHNIKFNKINIKMFYKINNLIKIFNIKVKTLVPGIVQTSFKMSGAKTMPE